MLTEVRPNRIKCLSEFFLRWRRRFCECQKRPEWENDIVWRRDVDGKDFDPARIADLYFSRYKPAMKKFMVDPAHNLDRHKIIALTQKLFMEELPITTARHRKLELSCPPLEVGVLNCSFSYYFGVHFLCRWHEIQNPRFSGDVFCELFHQTNEGRSFTREHHKYLMSELHCKFPAFLIAQLWFVIEQWGLRYVADQKNVEQ